MGMIQIQLLTGILSHAKQVISRRRGHSNYSAIRQTKCKEVIRSTVPRGHFAIYVYVGGDDDKDEDEEEREKKRFVVPISYLKHSLFQALLREAAEEFGFEQGIMHGLLLPCSEFHFLNLISLLNNPSS